MTISNGNMRRPLYALLASLILWGGLWATPTQAQTPGGRRATDTQVSCLTTSTTLLAGNARRLDAFAQSEDTTNPVWICLGASCATDAGGMRLAPGTTNNNPLISLGLNTYIGTLSCISTGGPVLVNVTEVIR